MLSAGYCLLTVDLRVIAAKTSVRPPTRPTYIIKIRINFVSVFLKPIICGVLCGVGAYTSFGIFNRFIPDFSLAGHNAKSILCLGVAIGFGGLIYVISMLFVKGISKDDVNMLPKGEKIAKILAKYGFIE